MLYLSILSKRHNKRPRKPKLTARQRQIRQRRLRNRRIRQQRQRQQRQRNDQEHEHEEEPDPEPTKTINKNENQSTSNEKTQQSPETQQPAAEPQSSTVTSETVIPTVEPNIPKEEPNTIGASPTPTETGTEGPDAEPSATVQPAPEPTTTDESPSAEQTSATSTETPTSTDQLPQLPNESESPVSQQPSIPLPPLNPDPSQTPDPTSSTTGQQLEQTTTPQSPVFTIFLSLIIVAAITTILYMVYKKFKPKHLSVSNVLSGWTTNKRSQSISTEWKPEPIEKDALYKVGTDARLSMKSINSWLYPDSNMVNSDVNNASNVNENADNSRKQSTETVGSSISQVLEKLKNLKKDPLD